MTNQAACHGQLRGDRFCRGLGRASAGLGIPQVLEPGAVTHAVGVDATPRRTGATVAIGLREPVAAAGLLTRTSPAWMWAGVAGDAADLALLGRALDDHDRRGLRRTVAASAAVAGRSATCRTRPFPAAAT